jgi:CheY-like chemotaxis protein
LILLVEDDPFMRRLFSKVFEANGYKVVMAEDGLEGLRQARQAGPDIIVLDVMLPKIDGYKVCRILKSDPRSKEIPIILHTARMGEKEEKVGKEAGADAFMVKNNSLNDLLSTLQELISKRSPA